MATPNLPPLDWRAFYDEYPITIWGERYDATVDAFSQGAEAVTLSGRHGIGKTMQYGRMVVNGFQPEPIYADQPDELSGWLRATEPGQVIVIDELPRGLERETLESSQRVFAKIIGRNPIIIINPGPTKKMRQANNDLVASSLGQTGFTDVIKLEDVAIAHVDLERAIGFLHVPPGESSDLAELLTTTPALRNPRVFRHIMDSLVFSGQLHTTEAVQEMLTKTIRQPASFRMIPAEGLLTISNERGLPNHVLFMSNSVSTFEARELYELIGEPLPDPDSFDATELGFDPYLKD